MPFLGIDIGTSATKALLLSDAGPKGSTVLATAESPHTLLSPKPGWSEQHPEQWWSATCAATKAVLKIAKKSANSKPLSIRAIGLSGQMHGSVFLGAKGKILRPALLWNDQRTAPQCAEIEQTAGGRAALIDMVSNPALTGFTAPKILWFRQHEPRLFAKCRQVLLPKDYIRFRLTGQYASEVSDASGTLLLNVKARAWHTGLMSALGLDPALFPPVVESQTITGHLTPSAATALGLPSSPHSIPVVGGAGDQAAGAVGTGVVLPGLVSSSMGTSGVIFATAAAPQTDPHGRVHTMCHAIPNTWCVFGCMLSAGGSLQWLRNTLFAAQVKKLKDPGSLYPAMLKEAQLAPPGSENLFFLPYLTGERCPHADPFARAAYIGLSPRHSRAHIIRSTLEGITFAMREQIAIFREMGIPIHEVRAQGGGARSQFWRQLQSDMYNAPVTTINATEGAALGAAILAAVGTGHFDSVPQATHAIIKTHEKSTPHKACAQFYNCQYTKYAALYPALAATFQLLAAPSSSVSR